MMNILIVGAGPAGLFCAGLLAERHNVTVIDKGSGSGRKLLISGGGKCNFTNVNVSADNFISANPHFCKSAISRYSQYDFLELLGQHGINYEERENGRLFCASSAGDILDMLFAPCKNVNFIFDCELKAIMRDEDGFRPSVIPARAGAHCPYQCVIIATGGLSVPTLGVSPIAYKVAESFNIPVVPVRAGLVPLTVEELSIGAGSARTALNTLSGISLNAKVQTESGHSFEENLLFTHRGLSGPVILQISNYWRPGEKITIDLAPHVDIETFLKDKSLSSAQISLKNALAEHLPKRLMEYFVQTGLLPDKALKSITVAERKLIAEQIKSWQIRPSGTEGYRTAEVTLGGVDVNSLSSGTMESKTVKGLYFIGECMDVSGQLGGYNLQWCWSSAKACADSLLV